MSRRARSADRSQGRTRAGARSTRLGLLGRPGPAVRIEGIEQVKSAIKVDRVDSSFRHWILRGLGCVRFHDLWRRELQRSTIARHRAR